MINTNNHNPSPDDWGLLELLSYFRSRIKEILLISSVVALISGFSSLFIDDYYSSTAVLLPSNEGKSLTSGIESRLGSLANVTGIDLSISGEVSIPDLASEVLRSKIFIEYLIDNTDFLPDLIALKKFNPEDQSSDYDLSLYNSETKKLFTRPSIFKIKKEIDDILSISINKKTGFIYLEVNHQSPIFAEQFLTSIIFNLNEYQRSKDINSSQKKLEFLKQTLAKSSILEVRQSISSVMEKTVETMAIASVNDDYLLKIIDPPIKADFKSGPRRLFFLIFGFLSGALAVSLILFFKAFFKDFEKKRA